MSKSKSKSASAPKLPDTSPEMPGGEIAQGMGFRAPDNSGPGLLIGYARVSTEDQKLDLQLDALTAAGVPVERIYQEYVSGAKTARPQLSECLKALRAGDTLVIYKLDRLGRTVAELVRLVTELEKRGVFLFFLRDVIDTKTAVGRCMFHMLAAFAQFERDIISERTKAGMKAARLRGHKGGRKRKLDDKKLKGILAMLGDPTVTMGEAAEFFGVGRSTIQREIARAREKGQFKELIAEIDKWRANGQRAPAHTALASRGVTDGI